MASSDVQRKLTAILYTDVVGYSRLMGDDPEGTLKTLTEYRHVFSDKIQEYKGRVLNAPGDSILAEFTSVLDAVSCAVDIQRELAERNLELPDDRRMDFRIGVTLGDVLVKEGAIYGDGVNVAARLESLADPGGICISGSVHEQVKARLPLHYEFFGEQRVKNIAEPVKTYRVLSKPGAAAHRVVRAKRAVVRSWKKAVVAVVAVVVVVGGGLLAWYYYQQRSTEAAVAAFEKEAAFPLPKKPSIAVLAFTNMSGDAEQEYFSDGISEDIITDLSKITNLFVIARSSAFTYKGKAVKVQQVGRELGVRYVLEGSVQRSGERVRITAQLIDAVTGKHLWAKRYDRKKADLFAVQDEITQKIVTELEVKLTEGDQARVWRKFTDNPEAYDYVRQGLAHTRRFRKEENVLARQMYKKALELDPEYSEAIGRLGFTHFFDARYGWSSSRSRSLKLAEELAAEGLAKNESAPNPHSLLSFIHLFKREHEQALTERKRVLELNPNGADSTAQMGLTLVYSGRPEEAIFYIKRGMRLSPYYPLWYLGTLGDAYRLTGRYEEAIEVLRAAIERDPDNIHTIKIARVRLVATLIEAGREEEARIEAAKILEINPRFSSGRYGKSRLYKDPKVTERMVEMLRKAGLPE